MYLFKLRNARGDARAAFDAFAATIGLTRETAVDFPNLTTTFVSPTYGYSIGNIDRGGRTGDPVWDPANQQRSQPETHDRFDFVDTGYGAVSRARRQRSRRGLDRRMGRRVRHADGGAAAVCLAASRRRSPSTGNRAGSLSVTDQGVEQYGDRRRRRPALPPHPRTPTALTPGRSSTLGSPRST